MAGAGGEAYSGASGKTRSQAMHVSCGCGALFTAELCVAVDAARDPLLAAKLVEGELHRVACPACSAALEAPIPVVYHDPGRRVLILVLPAAARHRELAERAALLDAMSRDPAHAVPAYARDFAVAIGGAGLREHLAAQGAAGAKEAQAAQRERDLLQRERDLLQRERDVAQREQALGEHMAELESHHRELEADLAALGEQRKSIERRVAELDLKAADIEQRNADLDARAAELDARASHLRAEAAASAALASMDSAPVPHVEILDDRTGRQPIPTRQREDLATGPFSRLDDVELPAPPPRRRHDSNATRVAPPVRDVAVERWILSRGPHHKLIDAGRARLLATLSPARLEPLLTAPLEVRVQLHRLPTYPIIAVAVAHKDDDGGEPLSFPFDLQRLDDRAVLGSLAQGFRFVLDLYDSEYLPVVQREIAAPLDANVRHVLAQGEAHLAAIPPVQRAFDAALAAFQQPGPPGHAGGPVTIDRWGRRAANLDEDSFALLPTPGTARLALGIVLYWTEPENEDYLLLIRSFPVDWWKRIRGRVLARAVDFGLALPDALAEAAIAEGHARNRRELVIRQAAAFADVQTGLKPNDLEPEQARDNWRSLLIQAEAQGVRLEGRAADLAAVATGTHLPKPDGGARLRASRSPDTGRSAGLVVAGEIRPRASASPIPRRDYRASSADELLRLLDDKDLRREAALELCRRGEVTCVGPVFGALRRMTRGEAVRVLPAVNHFGERAVPHLVDGLRSRKAYLRQGCALALGVLKSADGIDPLCDLLIGEPTDVWREVARAIGEVGSGAVMSLAARLREGRGEPISPDRRERIAWALAHVAAHGGAGPVETLAAGRDVGAAQAAKRALDLAASAKSNDAEVRGAAGSREYTVNRAFSRRFFEAMRGTGKIPALAASSLDGEGEEGMALDDADLLDADEELLDDEDILPG